MHILFLTDNFPPEVNAPASRTFEHAREWVQDGHQVTVITCVPNFPKGRVFAGYTNRLWQREEIEGVQVIRVWSYISANEGFIRRSLDYISFMISATVAALFVKRVDLIVATSPQFFTAVAGWLTGLLKRRPWVFELRDLWPESIRVVGAMKKSSLLDMLERLELFLYHRADAVISVTNSFRDNLIARAVPAEKIHVVTNGADLSRYKPMAKDENLIKRYELQDCFILGYIGTMGMAHGLDTVLDTAKNISKLGLTDIRILMLGDGAQKKHLMKRVETERIHNVLFLESVPKSEVTRYWSLLDVSLIHLKNDDLFKSVIPSKLFESMAMGVPVLFGVKGEAADIVRHHEVGLLIEPESAGEMTQAVIELHTNSDLRENLAQNCQESAQQFDRRELAYKMREVLLDVVS
ncbi:glycosyltransferase family 4 protein [Ochrobactrum chromiisoli]|uniref:Glycosyltransferase family 4 protein n=1 Tax=Ochrobactrum chromiisoli TaxID=2993941 RepID=A0ABT3QP47_9HYPH|nr:glycosyltransferase family 4 protein [Ochrobactrum chromiisoli]MCX2697386.1 glycosyltransferase family 4 protein [Ochrobactrum chromiisoli]